MFKKWFSRKKDEDDDDDFDEDFDDEDFDEDDFDVDDAGGDGPGDDSGMDDADAMSEPDAQPPDSGPDGMSEAAGGEEGPEAGDTEEMDGPADASEMGGLPPDSDGEIEDIDFGDDDDDDYDDDDYDDDEDDEDEEEGRFAAIWGNPWARYSIIGFTALFLLVGIGIGGWMFIAGTAEEEMVQETAAATSGGGLQPSASGSLNNLSASGQLLPPAEMSAESVSGEQLSSAGATSGLGTTGGLNALSSGGGTGGLNTLGGGPTDTAGGVIIPMTTASSFNQFPDYPTNDSLPKAPVPELLQFRDGELPLPKIAADGKVSWQEYARPSEVPSNKRRVALLISDLGLSRAATLSAISKLPSAVSLSFSPYAEELEQWMIRSRRQGHEVLLGMPLESGRFPIEDPGPLALKVNLPEAETQRRLETVLSSQQGYIGVEVSMGSKYTADEFNVRELLSQLNARGLMIVDGAWNNRSLIPRLANEMAIPHVISSVRLDEVMAKAAIDAKLKELDAVIELRGYGIGSTTITPAVLDRLLAWISSLPGKNIELVPVSALIRTGPES